MSVYETEISSYLKGLLFLFLLVPISKAVVWILNALVFVLNFFPAEHQSTALIVIALSSGLLVGGLLHYIRNLF